jgi:GntR family transcriptional repressor for pyruvate dehydrogenase complex
VPKPSTPTIEERTAPVGTSVRAPKTGELIARHLRSRIVRGEVAEGDALACEPELMQQYGVSRPTLREAFRILETESLLVIRRGSRGARVTAPAIGVATRYVAMILQMNNATIGDVYQARAALEPAAVGLLCTVRTDVDLIDLSGCVDELEASVAGYTERADPEEWARLSLRFHELVVDRAGNHTLALQSRVLREVVANHLSVAVHRTFDVDPVRKVDSFKRTIRSYRRLIVLVTGRDSDGAVRHWERHMAVAGETLLGGGLGARAVVDLFP